MAELEKSPVHELNNALCKIIGSAELVLDRVEDPTAREELQSIIELAEAAANLARASFASRRGRD